LFQGDGPNRPSVIERVGQSAELLVSVPEVTVDATAPDDVVEVVGVGEGEALEDSKVGLEEVEPRVFGRREDGTDAQPAQEGEKARVIVDVVQVVEDHVQSLAGVTGS